MSKERARRRAQREREAAALAEERALARAAADRRERRKELLTGWVPRPAPAPSGTLAARRRRESGILLTGVLTVNVLVFLATDGWELRTVTLLLSLLLTPIALVLISQK